ncbi:hypothetical protein B9Z55_005075 [Caenorhabditis nigoni]|uniref:C-type lectin domain-containing protein n=1 Tax=Caenorhabditis nigoni TaxID=1611254 RepID=A0A2G5UZ95_9PELO|nr:hypothetical protein B9Z55_005075 [Caenorhabditis nigoni]
MNRKLLILLSLIFISHCEQICSNGFKKVDNKCWGLVRQHKSRGDAERMCKFTDGAIMANTKTSTDNNALMNFLSSTGISKVWFGLQCFGNELKNCNWDDNEHLQYTHFENGPKNGFFYFDSDNGKWYNQQDNVQMPSVCELRPTTRDCGSECGVNFNNHCYLLHDSPKNFNDAENFCKQRNSHLVSLLDGLEGRFVGQLYRNEGKYWIGGHMNHTAFSWVDGSNANLSSQRIYQDGSCMMVAVDNDGNDLSWYGKSCDDKSIFICKRKVKPC